MLQNIESVRNSTLFDLFSVEKYQYEFWNSISNNYLEYILQKKFIRDTRWVQAYFQMLVFIIIFDNIITQYNTG